MDLFWREVLDPKTPMTLDESMALSKIAGYRYFTWEGGVYTIIETEYDGEGPKQVASVGNVR